MSAAPKPARIHDPEYRAYIRTLPCLLADREPCTCGGYVDVVTKRYRTEAAHVRSRGAGGGDEQLVPLCGLHHHAWLHAKGAQTFASRTKLDLPAIAKRLRSDYLENVLWPARDGSEA